MAEKNTLEAPTEVGSTVPREGAQRASSTHAVKAETQVAGRTAAMKDGVEYLTDKKDATIAIGNSSGDDQHPPKA